MVNIALVGDYNSEVVAHLAIPAALKYSSALLNVEINYDWIDTETIGNKLERQFNIYKGIWIVPASPYKNMEGVIELIKFARENHIPILGTCGGFQHIIIEYFRNVIGFKAADNIESNINTQMPVIYLLACSLVGKEGKIFLKEHTRIREICNTSWLVEKYHCNYGFNPQFIDHLKKSRMKVSGVDENNEIRIIELEDHPFFIATLFQPERSALVGKYHPIINSLLILQLNYHKVFDKKYYSFNVCEYIY